MKTSHRSTIPILTALTFSTVAQAGGEPGKWTEAAKAGKDLYAALKTNQDDLVIRLFSKDAPKTVANFVGLAAGEKEWNEPKSNQPKRKPFYDGLIFHRV